VTVDMRLVHHLLEDSARRFPTKTALICGKRRISFDELDQAANQLASALTADGVGAGDRVAVLLENSVEAVVALFGVLKAGAAFTLINATVKADKLRYVLLDERPAALITVNDSQRRRVVEGVYAASPTAVYMWVGGVPELAANPGDRQLDWSKLLSRSAGHSPDAPVADQDLGTIIYTSGTTGQPKGVMSLHRDMVFAASAIAGYLDNSPSDVIFCSLSIAFTYGLYQLMTAMLVGATLVLEKNFVFPHRALEVMVREGVTGLPGVPTMFSLLLGVKKLDRYDLSSLRYITNAAAPLPVDRIRQVRSAFPQAKFFSMYGQTECKRACYLPPEELDRRPSSVGIPIPGTAAAVVDGDGSPVPAGTIGELVVRGPHLMSGYWGKPEETAKKLRPDPASGDMVLHCGDLFRMDEDGFLYFVSRADDIIKCRGEKVSPNEIENALYELSGIADVVAMGVADDVLGEAIKVFVVRDEGSGLIERDIRAFCAQRLEDYMVPKYVEFRTKLPKSENGKTLRKDLRVCVE
jgi:long-chain acyl-CoA synthetase